MSNILTLGIEYYKNETGKEMDGASIAKIPVEGRTFEECKAVATEIITMLNTNANTILSNEHVVSQLKQIGFKEVAFPEAFALALQSSPKHSKTIIGIVRTKQYWFHLFDSEEMKKQRQTMFDQPDLLGDIEPRSFEDIMEETTKPINDNGTGLSFSEDAYFNKEGEVLMSIPDHWQVQADIY